MLILKYDCGTDEAYFLFIIITIFFFFTVFLSPSFVLLTVCSTQGSPSRCMAPGGSAWPERPLVAPTALQLLDGTVPAPLRASGPGGTGWILS